MTSPPRNSNAGASDDSPLRRWSRRKQAAREARPPEGGDAPAPEPPRHTPTEYAEDETDGAATGAGGSPAEHPAEASDATDTATDADMPPIESLDADSDYSQFMSPRVSDSLRRMALRKLFGTSGFNIRDGLDDYDEDFTRYQSLGDTLTADMKYQAQRRARLAQEENAPGVAAEDGDASPARASADNLPREVDAPAADERGHPPDAKSPGDEKEFPDDLG